MLAMETGWTPEVIATLPGPFRAACHWVLYARAVSGPEGFPDTTIPRGAPPELQVAAAKQSVTVARNRALLFPEDD